MLTPIRAPTRVNHTAADTFDTWVQVERILKVVDLARDRAVYPDTPPTASVAQLMANADQVEALLEGAVLMLRHTANVLRLQVGEEPLPPRSGSRGA